MLSKSIIHIALLLLVGLAHQANANYPTAAQPANHDDFLHFSLQQLIDTKVTVASLSEETVAQAPVPVSLITDSMIKQSGAQTLKELLLTYVPGFTHVEDQNEINISARGIFTSAQQKILIMVNGHRFNSRSYSMATPDHSISLNKIKQIEVLRGPASSLYGNVSLTATINIILKTAADIEQQQANLSVGNHGQKSANILLAKTFSHADIVMWADMYQADGEVIPLAPENIYSEKPQPNSEAIIYGIKDKHPYDIGISITTPTGEWLLNRRRSHYIEPFTAGGLSGEPYQYDSFEKVNGTGPGFGYLTTHFGFTNTVTGDAWVNKNRLYFDQHIAETAVVVDPITPVYLAPTWKELSGGVSSTVEFKAKGGDLLLGIQLESYKVYAGTVLSATNSFTINSNSEPLLPDGSESNYSGFLQYKYPITDKWQSNIGLRYDYKNRKMTNNIDQLSPRLGLLYQHKDISFKLSYSEAFVDATYWNRFSNLSSFIGATQLKPEILRSLQMSPTINIPQYHLQLTSNFFYDQSKDVIFRDNSTENVNYSNAGELSSWGVEQEVQYLTPALNIRANATYRAVSNSEKIPVTGSYINNIPKLTANITFDFPVNNKLSLHLGLRYIGKQFSPINLQQEGMSLTDHYPERGVNFYQPEKKINASLLVNSNLRYQISKHISLALRVDNLLNKQYQQGGTTVHPYPQKGRWFNAQLSVSF
ncbi:TonB-dependent receptor [Thalassotalea sp. PP2-459]|uniref:TonB-dependent receptor n=1 Tax=Thalassotalea sp. PP2-459 TaxID=1742724 RepID=UPI000942ABB3|nr:TonB-dependent receptor [Thalassotalea sp. PP2-459]OKY27034.1 hypothetical protein BI291_10400 [Thalassotalea sp. PP2-459]